MAFIKPGRSRLLIGCILGIVLALLFVRSSAYVWAQEPGDRPVSLDVILLIDNSWSMSHGNPVTGVPPSDPEDLRIRAAKFLVDYLRANAEALGANYRVGVVSFGGEVGDVIPLRLLQDDTVREGIQAEEIRRTDFLGPLQFATKEFREKSFGTGNRMAVILLTDGRPNLTDVPMSEQELLDHFEDLALLVGELQEGGVSLFVLGIGDAQEDRDNWTRLIPPEHYISITSATELADVYHGIVAGLIGVAVSEGETIPAGQTVSVEVEPYLERVVFSFVKNDPAIHIILISPTGVILTPTIEAADIHHSIYRITNPDAGEWKALWEGVGEVRYWVDKQYPIIRVEPIESPSLVGQPITITASLVRNNVTIVDPGLHLEAEITLPDGDVITQVLSSIGEGRYTGSYRGVEMEGAYTATARAFLDDEALSVRPLPVTVDILPLPVVATPTVQSTSTPTPRPSPMPSPSATPAAEQGTPASTPTVTPKPPWAGLVPPGLEPFFWPIVGGLGVLALILIVLILLFWPQVQFMEAIRSRDYAHARDMLDERDKLTGARWLYRAEDYVCRKLYSRESKGRVVYKELVSTYLRKAKEIYEAGKESDFETLRTQCAFVLECIKNDSFPTRLSSKIRDPFVRWFNDAVGIDLGDPRRVGELLSHTKDPDKLRELCQIANLRALEEEKEWREEVEPKFRDVMEQTLSDGGWGGIVTFWRLGDQSIATPFLGLVGEVFVEREENTLKGILNFVNANPEPHSRFYEALHRVFKYASEKARYKAREISEKARRKAQEASEEAQCRAQELSEEAQRQGLSSLLCDGYANLLWAVANKNARKVSLALRSILDALSAYDQGRHMQRREDVLGFCYLLMGLDIRMALSGDRRIRFFVDEVKDCLEHSVLYEGLLDPGGLLALQDQQLIDDAGSARTFLTNLQNVRRAITGSEALPEFEKTVVAVLLGGLEEVAQRRSSDSSQESTTEEGPHGG